MPTMLVPLQAIGGLLATPLGRLLVAVVALALVVLIGRVVLHVTWRLLRLAVLVIALVWVASIVPDALAGLGLAI